MRLHAIGNWLHHAVSRMTGTTVVNFNDPRLWDAFGADLNTGTGIQVNHRKALRLSAFWRGIDYISTTVAKVPCFTYRRLSTNGRETANDHPLYQLLKYKPNPDMTAFTFRKTLVHHVLTWGNAYAYIFRIGGQPRELRILLPDRTYPVREGGVLRYVTSVGGDLEDNRAEIRKLEAADVIHIKGLGFDGLVGFDVITMAAESLGMSLAQERFSSKFFANSATPSLAVTFPGKLSDKAFERMTKSWQSIRQGLENSHKPLLIEEGGDVKPFSLDANQSQLLQSREFSLTTIANWLGIPVHKVGGGKRTAYASLEQENQSSLDDCIDGWLVNFEQEFRDKLLSKSEKNSDQITIEFERKALVRANLGERGNFYRLSVGKPFMTANEARDLEGMNPIDGGDELATSFSASANGGGSPVAGAMPNGGDGAQVGQGLRTKERLNVLEDACHRIARRVGNYARRVAKKSKYFPQFLEGLREEHLEACRQILEPSAVIMREDANSLAESAIDYLRMELQSVYDTANSTEFAEKIERSCLALECGGLFSKVEQGAQ